MFNAILKKLIRTKNVNFSFECPDANEVVLSGDFNSWDNQSLIMDKDENGIWGKKIKLAPGRYEYRFFVDGQWQTDTKNEQICSNSFGTLNNIKEVS